MQNKDLKAMFWLIGRLAMYFTLLTLFVFAVAVTAIYIKDGSLVNLWEMQLDCSSSCLGEVLGVYTPQNDLSLMPNQEAVHSDIFYAYMAIAYLGASWLTIMDLHKREFGTEKK